MVMLGFSMKAAVVENILAGSLKGGLYENLVVDGYNKENA